MAPLEVMDVSSADGFHDLMQRLRLELKGRDVFVLFRADNDPWTGVSWCPDTIVAEPVIMHAFSTTLRSVVLVRVHVGDRFAWRQLSNPFHQPPFNIFAVPTLGRWLMGKYQLAQGALVERAAADSQQLRSLIDGEMQHTYRNLPHSDNVQDEHYYL
eukprot:TRINITY_DN1366_c0_g1_i3.p1 TRINITY_DN1366_c0_g1~~TRINITY_DN1366_c0_g1_i3.p1  ORF type:complete len:157 (+),score=24.08 TRINITY_DN1366_c0_g1_i3:75-545(+)